MGKGETGRRAGVAGEVEEMPGTGPGGEWRGKKDSRTVQKGRATRDTQPETRPHVLLREEAAETQSGVEGGGSVSPAP